ncbi:hypothetical protein TNCV_417151 [Trichonephila clavipes]|nr:hypothetical protein TNCV_417151 [Trichonephila clavipes]
MGRQLHLTGNVHDLARQLEKIGQEIPQETTRVLYRTIARHVTVRIKARLTMAERREIIASITIFYMGFCLMYHIYTTPLSPNEVSSKTTNEDMSISSAHRKPLSVLNNEEPNTTEPWVNNVNCTPPDIEQFPRPLIDYSTRRKGGLILHIFVSLYMFLGLAIICDEYFVPSLEKMCKSVKCFFDMQSPEIFLEAFLKLIKHDEAHFWVNGYVNKLTIWCALWAGGIIGPYFFKNDEGHNVTVNGDRYRAMITNFFIPELNNHDVQELWFQQDGATCHTARATIDLLKDTFGGRLISRFGLVNWPPRSCDLTPLDYFLWGYVKSLVYADKPQTLDHLEDNIRRVIANIRPQMLEKVIENWTSRLDYIRASHGMLNIQSDVAGATFMAAGSSAPELATAVIAVFVAKDDIGIGTVVGSAVYNIAFVVGICGLFAGRAIYLNWWPMFRDCLFYLISILALLFALRDETVTWVESVLFLTLYTLYIVFMCFNQRLEKWAKSLQCLSCFNSQVSEPINGVSYHPLPDLGQVPLENSNNKLVASNNIGKYVNLCS